MLPFCYDADETVGVICAYNEEEDIDRAVRIFRSVPQVGEVLVVDGGSVDRTVERAEWAGARVVEQKALRYPGKGIAVETALEETDQGLLVFFDADIQNMEPWQVEHLVLAVNEQGADHAMASFTRAGGRVTELTARPLLDIFFPEVRSRQPLTGEFATRREVLERIALLPDWGVESGLVIDLAMLEARVMEVDTGHKEHPMKPLAELKVMAHQVAKAIVGKAAQYGRLHRALEALPQPALKADEVTIDGIAALSVRS